MRVTYDPETDAVYIVVVEKNDRRAPYGWSGGSCEDGVIYDLDEEGRLVGIEVLDARKRLPASVIAGAEGPAGIDKVRLAA